MVVVCLMNVDILFCDCDFNYFVMTTVICWDGEVNILVVRQEQKNHTELYLFTNLCSSLFPNRFLLSMWQNTVVMYIDNDIDVNPQIH